MSRNLINSAVILTLLFMASPVFSDEPNYAPDRILVQFAPQQEGGPLRSLEKTVLAQSVCDGTIEHEYELVPGLTLVKLPEGQTVENAIESFNEAEGVLYAEPDYEIKLLSAIPAISSSPARAVSTTSSSKGKPRSPSIPTTSSAYTTPSSASSVHR
jgi:hypothetical protein